MDPDFLPSPSGLRRVAAVSLVCTVMFAVSHAGAGGEPTATVASSPSSPWSPSSADTAARIEITSTASSWDNLSELFMGTTPASPFGEGSVFVMRGELRNRGDKPVHHVVLRYELLDDKGKVLHDIEGYNRSAEAMRPDEDGKVHTEDVHSIPAGGVDSYRMVFFHDEVPRFSSQRVRVSEVHTDAK